MTAQGINATLKRDNSAGGAMLVHETQSFPFISFWTVLLDAVQGRNTIISESAIL